MNYLIIFGAKYLYLIEIILFAIYFFLQKRNKQKSIIILSVVSLPLAYIFSKVLASVYFDPRPFLIDHFTPLIASSTDNGFPSDHTLLASAIASIIFFHNKKLGIVAWVIAFAIGISRVLAGVHHFVDIVGSIVIVFVTMWFVRSYIYCRFRSLVL